MLVDQTVIYNQVESLPDMVQFKSLKVQLLLISIKRSRYFAGNEFLDLDKDFFNGLNSLQIIAKNILNLGRKHFPSIGQGHCLTAKSDMAKVGNYGKGKLFQIV
jgi:hypothetical protein